VQGHRIDTPPLRGVKELDPGMRQDVSRIHRAATRSDCHEHVAQLEDGSVAPRLAAGVVLLAAALWTSWIAGNKLSISIAGGLLASMLLSTARMMQRPTPVVALAALGLCVVVLANRGSVALWGTLVGLIIAVLFSSAWSVIWDVWITRSVNAELPSKVVAVGGTGTAGRALIVQHTGTERFPLEARARAC
jgi:hypothetical protein